MMMALVLGLLGLGGSGSAQEQPPAVYDPNNPPPGPPAQYDPNSQPPQYDPNQSVQYDPNGADTGYDPDSAPTQYGYFGIHPVPYEAGSGLCFLQGAHFHEYPPFDQYLFRQANGFFYFVGDLGDFGYNNQMWGYQANHPIAAEYGGGYCFINWPHHHHYPPPTGLAFNYIGGYYAYTGPWAPGYYRYRDAYWGYYGNYYRNNYYGGRYWTVRPRPIYRPSYAVGAPGAYRPGVIVRAPGGGRVTVAAPPRRAGLYVPPPVTRPGAYVAPPSRAGVRVPPPSTVRVAPPPPVREAPPPATAHAAPPPPARGAAPPPPARGAPPPPRAAAPQKRHR
jgi:hypothetical protein